MKKKKFSLSSPLRIGGPAGARSLKESVDYCTRCNACVQSCPSYLLHREEAYSPRGRNQIIRLLAERKIKISDNTPLIQDVTRTCLLCARCTAACAGALPMADHVLALRRAAGWSFLPGPLKMFLRLHGTRPGTFERLLSLLRLLRRLGLVHLLRISGLLRLPALQWIRHADNIVPRRAHSLRKMLKKQGINPHPEEADMLYLPSFETQYLNAEQARAVLRLLNSKSPCILLNMPSGLFEYIYGDLALSLAQAKQLLTVWNKLAGKRKLPVLTDSIEIYGFLKHFPVLFAAYPAWHKRAEAFAAKVLFVTDLAPARPTKTSASEGLCALDTSSILYPANDTAAKARKILKTHFGKNFVECEYSRFVTPAGGLAFVRGAQAQETALENVKDVARRQITQVYCLSGLAALELNAALRRHYPQARARHIVQMQAEP